MEVVEVSAEDSVGVTAKVSDRQRIRRVLLSTRDFRFVFVGFWQLDRHVFPLYLDLSDDPCITSVALVSDG